MSERITNILRLGLPDALLHALSPRPASLEMPVKPEEPATVTVTTPMEESETDTYGDADRQLHSQLRDMAALRDARTAQA
jgi:hypothetical protein